MSHPAGPPAAPAVCVRHPDRPTGLACTRCGRPACTDCLREASVGYQCVDCVAEGSRGVRRGTTVAGARSAGRGRPVVTFTLIALNLLVFVVTIVQARSVLEVDRADLFDEWVLVPGYVAQGEWWRLLTSGFLHFGLVHIALNMVALWMLGQQIEPVLGRWRFLATYLIALLGGSAACMLFYPVNGGVAGASGAVFGLLGAYLVVLIRMRLPVSMIMPTIFINVVISVVVPGIALLAHLGGALAGAAATAAIVYVPRTNRTALQTALLGGLTVLVVVLSVLGAARFF
ncbi:rhomboid family intramembrane serine protease [Pseudonocardia sp. CA-107938]|uniref:rhomboid family intramembrane serine protease n=1 Tax=Pseudonocardia sp. CA-107938 TaxID=3240021 RepID=UPI003D93F2EF